MEPVFLKYWGRAGLLWFLAELQPDAGSTELPAARPACVARDTGCGRTGPTLRGNMDTLRNVRISPLCEASGVDGKAPRLYCQAVCCYCPT